MVSTGKKKQSNRKFLSQLDDSDQDISISNTTSDRQESTAVNECTGDREVSVSNIGSSLAANENLMHVRTL